MELMLDTGSHCYSNLIIIWHGSVMCTFGRELFLSSVESCTLHVHVKGWPVAKIMVMFCSSEKAADTMLSCDERKNDHNAIIHTSSTCEPVWCKNQTIPEYQQSPRCLTEEEGKDEEGTCAIFCLCGQAKLHIILVPEMMGP